MSSVHECPGCGYQYHQDLGDEHEGFAPGTPFDELPLDWVCPTALSGIKKTSSHCNSLTRHRQRPN